MTTLAAERPAAIHLRPNDNVAIATRALSAGEHLAVGGHEVTLAQDVPMGHKVALQTIPSGSPIYRYGQIIGFASQEIPPGGWCHTPNISAGEFQRDYAFATEIPPPPEPITGRTFMGYRRPDGRVGTRNYVAVISSVNCSASVARAITERFDRTVLAQYENIDGLLPIVHKGGCAMQYDGPDHHQLNRVLAGFAKHPNIGAFLLVGLGCEVGTLGHLLQSQSLIQLSGINTGGSNQGDGPKVLHIQDNGGTQATIEAGLKALAELLPAANDIRRTPCPASEIILGNECGGSDGNSGVTANPALGYASDLLVACGGTAILAETPEIYGAEHLLTRRAINAEVGQKLVDRIRWWEKYTSQFGVEINNNPSPGNKAGGLTTIYEKSLGAVAKGGTTALVDVYQYAEQVKAKGFVIMDTPGYDPASVTGMVAGGANVVCFTTGRGSVFGCKPTPSIKIATNTPMYRRMEPDMDVNAGVVLEGSTIEQVGREIFELILAVASGQKTKSELLGVGDEEFVPWSIGPTL